MSIIRGSNALLLVLLFVGPASLAQVATPTLSGSWKSGEAEFEITQVGKQVTSRYKKVGPDARRLGFSNGDISLVGEFDGRRVRGQIRFHYPLEYRSLCPKQWESREEITLDLSHSVTTYDEFGRPSEEDDILSGMYPVRKIFNDCSESPIYWQSVKLVHPTFWAYPEPRPLPLPTDQAPQRIWVHADRTSALVGTPIKLTVGLGGRTDASVRANRNYRIPLVADRGDVQPSVVTLEKGSSEGSAQLVSHEAGDVKVSAQPTDGLAGMTTESTFCDQGTPTKHLLSQNKQEVPADGRTPITLTIKLVDDHFTPVMSGHNETVGVDYQGVGGWDVLTNEIAQSSSDLTVPPRGCRAVQVITSGRSGSAIETITFLGQSEKRKFSFFVQLSVLFVMWAAIGGVAGTVARLLKDRKKRRSRIRLLGELAAGALGGVLVVLMCFFGLLDAAPSLFPNSSWFCFLMGVAGGFMGSGAFDLLVRKISGGARPGGGLEDRAKAQA
jgi:hypothetical protein